MKALHRSSFVSLSLLAACVVHNQSTQDPQAGEYDEYYSENGGAGDEGADGADDGEPGEAKVRVMTGTKRTGRKKALAKALKPKKPPVKDGKKKRKGATGADKKKRPSGEPAVLTGVVPTMAAVGSHVEVFGTGLDQPGLAFGIGPRAQRVISAEYDRAVIEIVGGAGPMGIGRMGGRGRTRGGGFTPTDKTGFKFQAMGAGDAWAQPNRSVDHGLIGTVYAIEGEPAEVPAFDSLGDPIGTVAVDDLDVASTTWDHALLGQKGNYGIHFQGSLNVLEAGDYEICLGADNGALLFLDQNPIVDNDGSHEYEEACEALYIEPGEYGLDLLYYQGDGPLGLTLSWAKDGGEKTPVPSSALFPPETSALARK